jgi:hypothetical protein
MEGMGRTRSVRRGNKYNWVEEDNQTSFSARSNVVVASPTTSVGKTELSFSQTKNLSPTSSSYLSSSKLVPPSVSSPGFRTCVRLITPFPWKIKHQRSHHNIAGIEVSNTIYRRILSCHTVEQIEEKSPSG